MKLSAPAGSPASWKTSVINWCERGLISEPRNTTVLPHTSGYAMARAASTPAPFQGAMLSTTPAGTRTVIESVPGLSVGIVSPWI